MTKSKVTSAKMAKLASRVLKGYEPTKDEVESLAASVLAQRERDENAKKVALAPQVTEEPSVEAPVEEAPTEKVAVEEPEERRESGWWSKIFVKK